MTPEYILRAATQAMLHGKKTPHCFSAWQQGKGYTNDGSLEETRADYLKQLADKALHQIENLGLSPAYAEPGYEQPEHGILLTNWNVFPSKIDTILERAGYAVEWSDEWTTCDDCNNALRISPNGFDWEPAYKADGSETLCMDCYEKANPTPTFTVIEHYNGFELRHNASGKTHWLGDGVDVLDDLTPGEPNFREDWEACFNQGESETLEAYFPELLTDDTQTTEEN